MLSRDSLVCISLLVPVAPVALALSLLLSACDETPRGDQGIDFLADGGTYSVPPGPDAGPDAHGPCANETDSAGLCAQVTVSGIPATVLVACTGSAPPAVITCAPSTVADGGLSTYCCTTGIL
jgi:hypothetical protein